MAENSTNYGRDWRTDEIALVVADYFDMLDAELRGLPYSKAEHRHQLLKTLNRSQGAIEYKHQNISAVISEFGGMPWINGYKPAMNYQDALIEAIERFIDLHPKVLDLTARPVAVAKVEPLVSAAYDGVFVAPPEPIAGPPPEKTAPLRRLVRKFDPAARDERNRALGREGEEFVVDYEKWRLRDTPKYADNVRWVSRDDGDGAGYDICSFDEAGKEKLIEVKTTCGNQRTPFFLTRNEHQVAGEQPAAYRIYRVFQFRNDAKIFALAPPLGDALHLETAVFSARPR